MSTFRQRALDEAAAHTTGRYFVEKRPVSAFFGENVFDLAKMRRYMSQTAYDSVVSAVKFGKTIDRAVANEIASAMKTWATEKGATHYTHLFQPLTGTTAEKHEAFVTVKDGQAFERFSGNALVQQEPGDIPHGILTLLFSSWTRHSVSRLSSCHILVKPLT